MGALNIFSSVGMWFETFFELFGVSLPMFLKGMGVTLKLTIITLPIAVMIGLISCLFSISKFRILKAISNFYISLIRGTPLLVQCFFIYYGVGQILGIRFPALTAGVISLALNAGAYLSEIFRGGIQAISKGQMEAARSLGLPYSKAMIKVILPQAFRIVIPSVVNQFIITLKDTSIISVIGLSELTMQGKQIVARTMQSFMVWTMVGILYFVMIYILTLISRFIERRVSIDKGKR